MYTDRFKPRRSTGSWKDCEGASRVPQSFSNAPGAARLREVARRGSWGRDIYLLLKVERDVDETQRGNESASDQPRSR